ncbi:MAG: MogA/MoaB family molybdenum cofactor biosynthesis protein [Methanobacteriaceae archaeon]|jgi:molybdopterin adenylyltransferase|uniref:MogA/MoaB family molybdenum cofactor biosynthesis protein n=1 Tax=Methanobrevibacter TaxID=2172 RepID=UPI00375EED8B|nr:MogA/MoaB family molybdenum cofactor biosynthesis protein [Methanobacteriaceae archaeon]MDD4594176.1 MogA/MoaB family molybdenum cofactor biosynthesis protein [Methanobacteriaceae archaeon]
MISETMESHKKDSPSDIKCGIITLSDSLKEKGNEGIEEDLSGQYLFERLSEKYEVSAYVLIADESDKLIQAISNMNSKGIDVIFTTGGTGLESRDITIETLVPRFDKVILGFGEEFRRKSFEKLGSGALLSRSTAGIYNKTIIFALPGSPNAVEMGLNLIYPEIGHLVKHARK